MFPFSFQSFFPGTSSMISSTLEEKLQKGDCKLEDLLDEPNIVFDLKTGNNKLFKFFNRDKIKKLIRYITIEAENDDQIIGHKYPFIANDILSSDITLISDYFVLNDNEYKEKHKSVNNEKEDEPKEEVDNTLNIIENNIKIDENENLAKENEKVFDINDGNEDKKKENEEKKNESIENNKNNENNKKKENENNFELIDDLLNFVMNDNKELNDVLSSYFSNVMSKLIDKYTARIIKYLYLQRKDALEKIIEHSNQKSISNLTVKLLKIKSLLLSNEEKNKEDEIANFRNKLIQNFFKTIKIENINYDIDVKCSLLTELIEENTILALFIDIPDIYNYLFELLSFEINSNDTYEVTNAYSSILNFLISILKQIEINKIPLPDNFDINRKNFSDTLILTLPKIINNFNERKNSILIEGQFDQPYKSLGIINQIILELFINIMNYLQNLCQQFDNILIRNNFIKKSLDFFFNYQWNNIYHITFVKFIKLYLNTEKKHEILTKYLFEEIKINEMFEHFLKEKSMFSFNSKNQIKNGIYPHIIEIMYKLNAILGNKIFEDPTSQRKEGEFDFVKDENSNQNSISNSNFKVVEMKVESGKKEEEKKEEKKEGEKNEDEKKEEKKEEEKKEEKKEEEKKEEKKEGEKKEEKKEGEKKEEEKKEEISEILKNNLKNNENFKKIINEIISPSVKLYEQNLCKEGPIPSSQPNTEMSKTQLLIKLMGVLKQAKENPVLREKLVDILSKKEGNTIKNEEKKEEETDEINTDKIKNENEINIERSYIINNNEKETGYIIYGTNKKENENNNISNKKNESNIIEEKAEYNDLNYWKKDSTSILDKQTLEDCLKDL